MALSWSGNLRCSSDYFQPKKYRILPHLPFRFQSNDLHKVQVGDLVGSASFVELGTSGTGVWSSRSLFYQLQLDIALTMLFPALI